MSVSWAELKQAIKEVIKEENSQPDISAITREHACSCPDCYCGVIEEMNKTSDYACSDCGLPLGNEAFAKKLDHCPNCKSKNAKKVERRE